MTIRDQFREVFAALRAEFSAKRVAARLDALADRINAYTGRKPRP